MGLATNVIGHYVNPAAAWAFRFGKLSLKMIKTGPRPALLAETVGFFTVYHLISAKAWYAAYACRLVLRNRSTSKDAEKALELLQVCPTYEQPTGITN